MCLRGTIVDDQPRLAGPSPIQNALGFWRMPCRRKTAYRGSWRDVKPVNPRDFYLAFPKIQAA